MAANYRKVVDEIRGFMGSPDQTEDEQIKVLANQYAVACREVNDRLRRCGELLEQGLRPQAIELAEIEPDLLESTVLLDFPDRLAWEEIAASYGWDRAYGLKLETADLLNQGYHLEEQLGPLMHKHRLLALSQAPLETRIDVMRQIAAVDSISPFWHDDLRTFETARFLQLAELGRRADQASDVGLMTTVVQEVRTGAWLQKPPSRLVRHAQQLASRISDMETLPRLAEQLGDAHQSSDLVWGRELRAEWNEALRDAAAGNAEWQLAPHLGRSTRAPLEWLKAEDRREALDQAFQQELDLLYEAIQAKVSWSRLRQHRDAVLAYNEGIPEPFGDIYRNYRNNVVFDYVAKMVLFIAFLAGSFAAVIYLLHRLAGAKSP
ncbi:MAG: hypothetical protein JWN86_2652 [Planctomycetota bacterium]|nr:hypothetical protein [Planctomycetota bacterium]